MNFTKIFKGITELNFLFVDVLIHWVALISKASYRLSVKPLLWNSHHWSSFRVEKQWLTVTIHNKTWKEDVTWILKVCFIFMDVYFLQTGFIFSLQNNRLLAKCIRDVPSWTHRWSNVNMNDSLLFVWMIIRSSVKNKIWKQRCCN